MHCRLVYAFCIGIRFLFFSFGTLFFMCVGFFVSDAIKLYVFKM